MVGGDRGVGGGGVCFAVVAVGGIAQMKVVGLLLQTIPTIVKTIALAPPAAPLDQ